MNNAIKRNSFFSKLLEVVLEEKRREIIKECIKEGKISLKGAIKG
jgi:hypothetical protein